MGAGTADAFQTGLGVFGSVNLGFIETEFLKALLASSRYELAKKIYEESGDSSLDPTVLKDAIVAAAMNAFDNASNPNRTRGLKRCDEM
ncbi:unnamed protein product [Parascedosporium putredinis]|uniref:Sec39 domain-containing protein n=1 Tax=Parascedosporium putredinis TaxID=1442378 RepID=A0A9P1GX97_9PEZI|nr:unnamed protein product [Parascedosporium putredinis]CAI7990361.1 unnamed protein product [Parascedosporium putredinis]